MHYVWHCTFIGPNEDALYRLLCDFHVRINVLPYFRNNLYSFDIPEIHPFFQKIQTVLYDSSINSERQISMYPHAVYSAEEYVNAQWLTMRSSFSKVFQCNYEQLVRYGCIYKYDSFGYPKAMHRWEDGDYILSSPVKWGRNHIASSSRGESWLCCDDTVRNLFQKNGIQGLIYKPVTKKATGLPIENIHQMVVPTVIPNDGVVGLEFFEEFACPHCGMRMIALKDGRFLFGLRRELIPEGVDAFRLPPMITHVDAKADARGRLVVSQKVYRTLVENTLNRSLWFEPITVV